MIEVYGNLWTYPADWRIITTNGFLKKSGECVMGRGCAKEYATMNTTFPRSLGNMIKANGNHVFFWHTEKIITFPVKHQWFDPADLELIRRSIEELTKHESFCSKEIYVMPRPGCGNGKLPWDAVKPLLIDLPDNIRVITYG